MSTMPPTDSIQGLDVRIRPIGALDRDAIQSLFLRSADYVRMVTGGEPDPFEAERILEDVPPGKTPADKEIWGLFDRRNGRLIGVVDCLKAYPRDDIWFVGLLMLDPQWRRLGLGAEALSKLTAEAASHGAKELHLACVPQNGGGLRFWRREGFREIRLAKQAGTDNPATVIVLAKDLEKPLAA